MADLKPTDVLPQALTGLRWTLLGTGFGYVLQITKVVLLGRLLFPEDFGIAGIGLAAGGLLAVVLGAGLPDALIRLPGGQARNSANYALGFSLFVVIPTAVLALPLAHWGASLYADSRLLPVLLVAFAAAALQAGASIPEAVLQQRMRFGERVAARVLMEAVVAVGAVCMAAGGWGYWSLILPPACGFVLLWAVCWTLVGRELRPQWSVWETQKLLSFGWRVMVARLLFVASRSVTELLLGRILAMRPFGYFVFARRVSDYPRHLAAQQYRDVAYSGFSKLREDRESFRTGYLRSAQLMALLLVPAAALGIGLADPLVPLLFGEKWLAAVPVVRVLCAEVAVMAFSGLPAVLVRSLGFPQWQAAANGVQLALLPPVLYGIHLVGGSVLEFAVAVVVLRAFADIFVSVRFWRRIGAPASCLWSTFRVGILAGGGVLALNLALGPQMARTELGMVARTLLLGTASLALWGGLAFLVDRDAAKSGVAYMKQVVGYNSFSGYDSREDAS